METKDSAYVSSTDVSRSPRRSQPPKPSTPELPETYTHLRFLVSNIEAGCVIGKGGTTISDLQSESGARIQLSRGHELFPGTNDRIIMISGSFDEVLHAMDLILQKLSSEIKTEDGENADPKSTVRLIVPNSSCGGLIGKGGATIKWFMEQSGAAIKVSPQDNYYRLVDRLVMMVGFQDEQMRAIDMVLSKLLEDSHYSHYVNTPFSYAAAYGMNLGPSGLIGRFPNNKEDQSNSVTIGISDTRIGLIVGRGGRNVMEISQMSGARIKISDRGDFMSGTTDRKVTISGSRSAIHTAEDMIMHKVNSVLQRVN